MKEWTVKKAFVWIDKIDQSLADSLYLPFSFVQDRFELFLHDKKTPEIFNYTYYPNKITVS